MKRKSKQNPELGSKQVSKPENMENGSKNKMLTSKDRLTKIITTIIQTLENSTRTVWTKFLIGEEVELEVKEKVEENKAV